MTKVRTSVRLTEADWCVIDKCLTLFPQGTREWMGDDQIAVWRVQRKIGRDARSAMTRGVAPVSKGTR